MVNKAKRIRIIGAIFAIFTLLSGLVPILVRFDHKPNSRIVFYRLNDPVVFVFYLGIACSIYWCFELFAKRIELLNLAKEDKRKFSIKLFWSSINMKKVLRGKGNKITSSGIMHAFIYFGFLGLLLATILLEIDHQLPTPLKFLHGRTYGIYSAMGDISGLLFVTGLLWAIIRRYCFRPKKIRNATTFEDGVILSNLLLIGITGFIIEGLRINFEKINYDSWSFVGFSLSKWFNNINSSNSWAVVRHEQFWILHVILFTALLLILPVTKMRHMINAPINTALTNRQRPEGALPPMDGLLEGNVENVGAQFLSDFTSKSLFDTLSCTQCGRCTEVCPAQSTGKLLDPRKIVLSLASLLDQTVSENKTSISEVSVFDKVTPEEVWACTTCKACDNVCPVNIDIMDKIIDIRRYLMLIENDFPTQLNSAYRGLESTSNPWGLPQSQKTDWVEKAKNEGVEVKVLNDGESAQDYDVLYWVGCAGSFDEKNIKVTIALSKLLQKANKTFAILGNNEKCTGDPARRSGNEYLFQMLATENIATLNKANPKVILTQCPHCFNTLLNEYPQLGGNYKVMHHSQFLSQLLESKELVIENTTSEDITIHDSCYLTRHNNITTEPRKIVGNLKGINVFEMNSNKSNNFCCGAGGAQFFMEEKSEDKINIKRVKQAQDTGAKTIATMCPFCNVMMSDGVSTISDSDLEVKDIAILLAERL